jgi:GTP-binding protein
MSDEAARKLFARPCTFIAGAASADGFPPEGPPEIAFAGRSNVGKSSLLNALVSRKTLARASSTPGRTQEINFFDLSGALRLVDLPGYGFAVAAKKKVADWTRLARAYLAGRATLRRVIVLVDARHGLKPSDHDLLDLLDEASVPAQVVLTKADKVSHSALAERIQETRRALARHRTALPSVLATSAEKGTGLSELRLDLWSLIAT